LNGGDVFGQRAEQPLDPVAAFVTFGRELGAGPSGVRRAAIAATSRDVLDVVRVGAHAITGRESFALRFLARHRRRVDVLGLATELFGSDWSSADDDFRGIDVRQARLPSRSFVIPERHENENAVMVTKLRTVAQ